MSAGAAVRARAGSRRRPLGRPRRRAPHPRIVAGAGGWAWWGWGAPRRARDVRSRCPRGAWRRAHPSARSHRTRAARGRGPIRAGRRGCQRRGSSGERGGTARRRPAHHLNEKKMGSAAHLRLRLALGHRGRAHGASQGARDAPAIARGEEEARREPWPAIASMRVARAVRSARGGGERGRGHSARTRPRTPAHTSWAKRQKGSQGPRARARARGARARAPAPRPPRAPEGIRTSAIERCWEAAGGGAGGSAPDVSV